MVSVQVNCEAEVHLRLKIWVLALVLFEGLSVASACGAEVQLATGDFVAERYLRVLEKTGSPFEAEMAGGINLAPAGSLNLVSVRKKNGAYEVSFISNFHEGGPSFLIDRSGKVELEDSAGLAVAPYRLRVVSRTELSISLAGLPIENFIATKDLQQIVCSKTVAGQYHDKAGRIYVIKQDGILVTPQKSLRFTVGVDHVPYQFDYIELTDTHTILKFARSKCELNLFKVTDAVENQHQNDAKHVSPWKTLYDIKCNPQ